MKRNLMIVVAAAVALAACSKPAATGPSAPKPGPAVGSVGAVETAAPSYIMLQGLSLWTKDGGNAVYAKSATIADAVRVAGDPVELEYKGSKREYTRVVFADGSEYYARSPYVVAADRLAVVRDDKCVLYNEPRVIAATTASVPRLTVVAIVDPSIVDGFVKVSYSKPLPEGVMVADKWVKRETLADAEVDVLAAVSLAVVGAVAEKDKALKINILEGAAESYAASAFAADISNALLALGAGASAPVVDIVPESFSGTINAEVVNVRSSPSADASAVARLSKGDEVTVVERTVSTFAVNGFTAHWYRVSAPVDGWVFGVLIDRVSSTTN